MSASQLEEHRNYITDRQKISAYRRALQQLITPDSAVLDLGAGTGLLGLLAAECGARVVYAVDSGSIINLAREVAAVSPHSDRIVHIKKMTTEIELPELVDVVVCDQIGGLVHDAGILEFYDDAKRRLLKPGGVMIPDSFEIFIAPVAWDLLEHRVADWDRTDPHGFDMSAFAEASANTEHRINLDADRRLGSEQLVCSVASDHNRHFGGAVSLEIERAGRLCGFVGTFVATMAPGVTLSNAPWRFDRFSRWQNFYPLRQPLVAEPGDRVDLRLDVSPKTGVSSWRGGVTLGAAEPFRFANDSLHGAFSGPADISRASGSWVPKLTRRLDLGPRILGLADGTLSVSEIAARISAERPAEFASDADCESFVRQVLNPFV